MARLEIITGIFVVGEVVLAALFWAVANFFYRRSGLDARSIVKGVIERAFLFVTLVNGYPHALTFFSAVKLATRLKHEESGEDRDRFNDYYLIGNLISVLAAIGYVGIWNRL